MELVKEQVFHGSKQHFNIFVNELESVYKKLGEMRQRSKKSDKTFRTQIASLKEENKKLKEQNSQKTQQCQELKQRLIQVALMEKKSKEGEGVKRFMQSQMKMFKEQLRGRVYNEEEWKAKSRERSKQKKQQGRGIKEMELFVEKEMRGLARQAIKQVREAEGENKKMQEMKGILERELEFTKTMLLNVQGELKQRGDIMQRLVEALNAAEAYTHFYAGVSEDSQEQFIRRESTDSEAPRSYIFKPSSRPKLEMQQEGRGGLRTTAKFLTEGKNEERFEKMKTSFSSQRSGISQQNLIEKIESSQQEVNNTLNQTVCKIERTLSHIKVMETPREIVEEEAPRQQSNLPLRRSVSPPKTLIDCNQLVRPPLYCSAQIQQEERKGEVRKDLENYRLSNDNEYEKGGSQRSPAVSQDQSGKNYPRQVKGKKLRSYLLGTPQKGRKKQNVGKSTFSQERRLALSPLERPQVVQREEFQGEEKKRKNHFSLQLERIKSIDSTMEYLEEEKKILNQESQAYERRVTESENVSPTSELMKKIKSKRIKSLAEDSVSETITSLCVENNRLKEELEQLEERYEIEKDDFERRLSAREQEGSKSVRILEEQIRYLNSQLESIQDQLSGISFASPRMEVLQSGDNFDGLHSGRIVKEEAQSDKPETIYDFSELEEDL